MIEIQADPESRRHPVCSTSLLDLVVWLNAWPSAGARCWKSPSAAWMVSAVPVLLSRHTPISAAQLGQMLAVGLDELDPTRPLPKRPWL